MRLPYPTRRLSEPSDNLLWLIISREAVSGGRRSAEDDRPNQPQQQQPEHDLGKNDVVPSAFPRVSGVGDSTSLGHQTAQFGMQVTACGGDHHVNHRQVRGFAHDCEDSVTPLPVASVRAAL